jgi:hypothetical protein
MTILILTVVAHIAVFSVAPMVAASAPPQSAVDYDTFMKQDTQSRIKIFNEITPENRADLVRTQIQRWMEKNKTRLTTKQMNMMNENLAFVTADVRRLFFPH